MNNSQYTKTDTRSSQQIQQDIRDTRSGMDNTLDRLNDRLSPRSILNGVMDWFDHKDSKFEHLIGEIG